MPVNRRYPIAELISACKYYIERTNRRISFEWALIRGETDTVESARDLGVLLKGMARDSVHCECIDQNFHLS